MFECEPRTFITCIVYMYNKCISPPWDTRQTQSANMTVLYSVFANGLTIRWHRDNSEPRYEKTGIRGFRPGLTQTGLCSHRIWLEACNFGFRKKRDCTIRVAKTKALISFAVTAKLICLFVFANAKKNVFS